MRQAVAPFDFSAVVRRAYADGVRIFVEIGPGASCTRMIGQILAEVGELDGEKIVARSACAPGADGVGTILRLLGQLLAEGVKVDLNALYGGARKEKKQWGGKIVTVKTGGDAFMVPAMPVREDASGRGTGCRRSSRRRRDNRSGHRGCGNQRKCWNRRGTRKTPDARQPRGRGPASA